MGIILCYYCVMIVGRDIEIKLKCLPRWKTLLDLHGLGVCQQ